MTQFTDEGGLSDEEGPQFNNLVVDKNTGRVYIGAVNKLYQLSPNLEQMVGDPVSFPVLLYFLKKKFYYIIYVSALHQSDLLFQIGTVTGPSLDSPHCSVLPDCPPQVFLSLPSANGQGQHCRYSKPRLPSENGATLPPTDIQ